MDSKTELFIEDLITQLSDIHQRTIALLEEVPLVRREESDRYGRLIPVTILDPSPRQQLVSATINRQYRDWVQVVLAFVTRYSQSYRGQFVQLGDTFCSYILLRRSGSGISDQVWRELFVQESSALFSAQVDLIRECSDAFSLFKARQSVRYFNFDVKFSLVKSKRLRLLRVDRKEYRMKASCLLGNTESDFVIPFDDRELETLLLRYGQPRENIVRGREPNAVRPISEFGRRLYDAVFSGRTAGLFLKARQHAQAQHLGIRLRLLLGEAPELGDVPWEFLYDGSDFLCLASDISVTRYLESPTAVQPLLVQPPFRLLATTSSPRGWPQLDVVEEQVQLESAVAPLTALGLLRVDFTPDGSLRTLQRMLKNADMNGSPYHIWHFVGHGKYDTSEDASLLIFENDQKREHAVSGFELGTLFGSYAALRLVVLNACEGARTSRDDALAGVASALMGRGLPAIVAMQFEISDTAAIAFAEEFYTSLADGLSIDSAVAEARRSIFFLPNYVEWANPVLFLRAADSTIFDSHSAV